MAPHQGQARLIASSGICKILSVSLLLTVTLVIISPKVFDKSTEKTLQAIHNEMLSEKSKIGQYLSALAQKKTLENIQKIQQMQSVISKIKIPGDIDSSLLRSVDLPPLNEYWSKILHFVPKTNNQNCLTLFTTESSKSIVVAPEWQKTRDLAKMSAYTSRYAPQHDKLTMLYQELAQQKFVHTVCEIGFNVGQSAIAWLTAKPGIKYYAFDLGVAGLPQRMGKDLEKLFPGHFKLMIGDSTKTVPAWIEEGVKCDIVSVDGGHEYPTVIQDLHNMRKAAAQEHIIVLDDIYYPGVNKAWKEMVNKGAIHHLFDCWLPGMDVDVAVGHYNTKE